MERFLQIQQTLPNPALLELGPVYASIVEGLRDGTYTPGRHYFDGDENGLGLYGIMEGEELTDGLKDMPEEVLTFVRNYIADIEAGKWTRRSVQRPDH